MLDTLRYDALGRRILVRSLRETPLCAASGGLCVNHLTRTVWSGDHVVWEMRPAEREPRLAGVAVLDRTEATRWAAGSTGRW